MNYVLLIFGPFVIALVVRSVVYWRFASKLRAEFPEAWKLFAGHGNFFLVGHPIFDWSSISFLLKRTYKGATSMAAETFVDGYRIPVAASFFAVELAALPIYALIVIVLLQR